ncbi:hypothetical protein DM02DRAFT_652460 [Periconia macrospinosa]|uniref:Uncharacterized protein n=1 Tax=Periconia macrospinosa TaxID=97972 RepID=A0A2V1DZP6_9PLEO|nr:hypothetical protein DM02DRAFT_652460 [Periconia macrospinosa]
MNPTEKETREDAKNSPEITPCPKVLPIPLPSDPPDILHAKVNALADVVKQQRNIAAATNYRASAIQERNTTKKAVAQMHPEELYVWKAYTEGLCTLPAIEWDINRLPAPTSTRPLRIARRRAEALNRLYKTNEARPEHVAWITQNKLYFLPLIKAMARVIGAEIDSMGGQNLLDAEELAEYQTLNKIPSNIGLADQRTGGAVLKSSSGSSAHDIFVARRNSLHRKLMGGTRKRRQESNDTDSRKAMKQ